MNFNRCLYNNIRIKRITEALNIMLRHNLLIIITRGGNLSENKGDHYNHEKKTYKQAYFSTIYRFT